MAASPKITLEERLGDGVSATVWRGRDEDGRPLTVKCARDAAATAALAREAVHAHLALGPHLPGLVSLGPSGELTPAADVREGAGLDPSLGYLALRFRPGTSLSRHLASPEPDQQLLLQVARDVGGALRQLHASGIAHGDVKPANIIVAPDGNHCALIDLGMAGHADDSLLRGGTPRYLGTGDASLGSARARDLLALALVLAEVSSKHVAQSRRPLPAARAMARGSGPGAAIIDALLAPDPGARPAAAWVARFAAAALDDDERPAEDDAARVRASYLRLRWSQLLCSGDEGVADAAAHWLHDAHHVVRQARTLCRRAAVPPPESLRPLGNAKLLVMDRAARQRWFVRLVGISASHWPLGRLAAVSEAKLALGLERLARRQRPELWSFSSVEAALGSANAQAISEADDDDAPPSRYKNLRNPETLAAVSIAVAQIPSAQDAIECVEREVVEAPASLVIAAADALRLANQLGRGRTLMRAKGIDHHPLLAQLLRRSGDAQAARIAARAALDQTPEDGAALACLARIELDEGNLEMAVELATEANNARGAEVAALAAMRRGEAPRARNHAARGLALAAVPEERARLHATLAYVWHGSDAARARAGYREAVLHAVRAAAVLEEASYRTGEAAACVDLGELDTGIATATRAALLWDDVLQRPAMAARAWLSRAAALVAVQAHHQARAAAQEAAERARHCDDERALGYAALVEADSYQPGTAAGLEAAERAASWLPKDSDDGLHAAARLLTHGSKQHTSDDILTTDEQAVAAADLGARLAWWGARAERCLLEQQSDELVLQQLLLLADSKAAVTALGPAMHSGAQLARRAGDSEALGRLDTARQRCAVRVLQHCSGQLAEAASACPWLQRSGGPAPMEEEQALDLQHLVRALGERENLQTLLDRVLDMLLLWTRAERGLLLLSDEEGELQPRAARNLGRDDLADEQLEVSKTLARQAFDSRMPVVAIDAMQELSSSHASVHALKLRSIMALPLIAGNESLGVVYLDDRARRGAFGDKELRWAQAVAPVAALAITDARAQAALRTALNRAEEASAKLEDNLARKESALALAERQLAYSQEQRETRFRYGNIIGHGRAMRRVLLMIDRVAPTNVPVLLRGESGSGKELLARALHQYSPRAKQAFVGENCGALPDTLLESVLFGHVRGAFTGADRASAGLFTAADGGTLFLDEIGEMSAGMQTKLLRVLEDGMVRPVGATQTVRVDVRILAATHRDLEQMVEEGHFREDLYYRLNVITINVPSLRERQDDIPALVAHLIAKHAPNENVRVSQAAMDTLIQHHWPGNVRQLENEIRRALLLSEGTIENHHLSLKSSTTALQRPTSFDLKGQVDELERQLIGAALEQTKNNQTQASKLLGISRYGMHKMMIRLGMR